MKKVVVGLSGGVDSSVAALLLKEQGYEVIGLFMKNWHDDSVTISKECPWLDDSNDALIVAEKLGIPFQTVDLSAEYKERIVDYMFREYEQGRTPNPDVLCNREIKFDLFLKLAMDLGADFVATGHYCRKESVVGEDGKSIHRLLAGKDPNKDQSYFLCQLNQEQLSKALFPIGGLLKSEVREIATAHGLITADKKDSQGLCFIGKVRLPEFLQQQLQPKKGPIVEIPAGATQFHTTPPAFGSREEELAFHAATPELSPADGKVVGNHPGAHFFTIGQRKGLDVGGTPEPLFVIQTDVAQNIIYTGQGKSHPGLYRRTLFVAEEDLHWVRPDLALEPDQEMQVQARIRYRQELQPAVLYKIGSGLYVDFKDPQSAITPGQFVAWYKGEELIGSGVIA
ncbi:MAG: tRNA 2-thiouridine(34) synthase MnmA [Robiginitalea sp.]|nr:tRNA 2-thiouridine(34) synthase MnmA [Robiginitalea sp.]